MTDAIFGIRQDVLKRRLSGGNSILWSAKDAARIRQHVFELSEKNLLRVAEVKLLDSQRHVAGPMGAHVLRAMDSSALSWQFQITNEAPDLCFDVIRCAGWNLQNFRKNGPVLDCHNSAIPPLGQSSMPWPSGSGLTANVTFPEPGTSAASDQVRAMVAAGVLRGASVGFIPGKFKFSSDPQRPLGIDFLEGHILTEWSICSVPCQPVCLVVGPAAGNKSARRRNVPVDNVPSEDGSDFECHAIGTMPIDASDDAYNATAAKAGLLARFSPAGTITDEARDYFFAVDVSAPFAASSYKFPFCRAADGAIVASKIGWRQSFAALEKSNMSGIMISEARSLVDHLEARLGEVKTAALRREARAFAAKVRSISESITDVAPLTQAQRIAEAQAFRRLATVSGK
jgi:hypothetical protein